MYVFTKSRGELVVTAGVSLSCSLLVAFAIPCISRSDVPDIVIAVFVLLLVFAVLAGNKAGYLVTRYVWRIVAFASVIGVAINPLAWSDIQGGLVRLELIICLAFLIAAAALFLSHCLSEHAKLRKIEGAQRWRSFP
jgi:hypothetical protein